MKVELLFSEISAQYGEKGDQEFLKQIVGEGNYVETSLSEKPAFLQEDIDLVFMGPLTEQHQLKVIDRLSPYKEEIREKLENGQTILCVGNALEVFCEHIVSPEGKYCAGLGFFPFEARQNLMKRHVSFFLGVDEDLSVVGFKTQFTMLHGPDHEYGLFKKKRGCGLNPESGWEGIRYKNFFGTYLLGPFLILNPLWVKKLLANLGEEVMLPYESVLMEAYEMRKSEFEDPKTFYGH